MTFKSQKNGEWVHGNPKIEEQIIRDVAQDDNCFVCRWHRTNACPRSNRYVGAWIEDPELFYSHNEYNICHRYMISRDAEEIREQRVMDKLHENLDIEYD